MGPRLPRHPSGCTELVCVELKCVERIGAPLLTETNERLLGDGEKNNVYFNKQKVPFVPTIVAYKKVKNMERPRTRWYLED